MSDPNVAETEVEVIRNAILSFISEMKKDKRMVEQEIREKTENIRSTTLNSGASQFSYQDVDNLSRQFKDEILNYYRNTIHLKLIANASSRIKDAIETGLIEADVVQQEWLEGFKGLQDQINQYQQVADKAEQLQSQLEGKEAVQGDVQELRAALQEKDQIIAEKDQEIMNLNEGLARMENQVNSMGQSMLENSMTIEELQEAINDRDEKIAELQERLANSEGSSQEIDLLKQQLQEAKDRERELQQEASNASTDLVTQLQDDLEETRSQVLDLRRDLVAKNEEMHNLRLEQDEQNIKFKQQEETLQEISAERDNLAEEKNELNQTLNVVKTEKEELEKTLEEKENEIASITEKLDQTETQLTDLHEKLKGYEGKVAMSAEEQEKINKELRTMKDQLSLYKDTIEYLKKILGSDVKFRTMLIMSSMEESVRLDDLATAVGAPESVISRIIVELSSDGVVETEKEGRFIYCNTKKTLEPPMLLQNE